MGSDASAGAARRPSMDDVARAAGVSKGAVSKVIRNAYGVSDAMRTRVEDAIRELGYRPRIAARAMRGSSFSIGLEIPNLGNDFLTQIMQGAAAQLAGSSYQLMIAPGIGELSGEPVLENLADRQVDGLIAISPEVTPAWLETLALELPIVLIGRHDASANYDTVTNDDVAGTTLALDHLRTLGHERIAHLTMRMQPEAQARAPHSLRLLTYEQMTADAGLDSIVEYCGDAQDDAYAVARELISRDPSITAIFAGHDTLAIGVLRALADLGLTTKDVSVVGYDDIQLAGHPMVSLSSVSQFGEKMGAIAIELLMERISTGRTAARHYQIHPELRVRASSQAARSRTLPESRTGS
ncbi:LacI family DNA-binding transcriptional regulator [Streptomyces sp. NBC_00986]|uniref:LacI family DNA-binding transcriptional regulator n=2 Tax=unclassified Streptomyces TaxID=2593676 RepID=UPI0038661A0C|nr:LacI family transcriptional regulator [Streptomyces sp. NBC_00986]